MINKIIKYSDEYEKTWDDFVFDESINGTFLQTRKFLNYHPKDRFVDSSIMIFDSKDHLITVCPGCVDYSEGRKTFNSHKGSTYGGLVLNKKAYTADRLIEIIRDVEEFLKSENYQHVIFKPTMNLLSKPSMDLMDYCYYYLGYDDYKELNIYVDFSDFDPIIINNLSKMKRRIIRKCDKSGLEYKEIYTTSDIEKFHFLLEKTLEKYNVKPVHTVSDLLDLKKRFQDCIKFYGCFLDNNMVSGSTVFEFPKYGCAHTQYLVADPEYNHLSPMSYVYYKTEEIYYKKGFRTLSWGITTEDRGKYLNEGLTASKEAYGSTHNIFHVYEKDL